MREVRGVMYLFKRCVILCQYKHNPENSFEKNFVFHRIFFNCKTKLSVESENEIGLTDISVGQKQQPKQVLIVLKDDKSKDFADVARQKENIFDWIEKVGTEINHHMDYNEDCICQSDKQESIDKKDVEDCVLKVDKGVGTDVLLPSNEAVQNIQEKINYALTEIDGLKSKFAEVQKCLEEIQKTLSNNNK